LGAGYLKRKPRRKKMKFSRVKASCFRSKMILAASVVFIFAVLIGCTTKHRLDPGCGWVNEEAVSKNAAEYAQSSRDGSMTAGHVRSMNTILQELFEIGSCGGVNPERGIKAMDVFKNAYLEANGDNEAWLKALEVRRLGPVQENDANYPSVIPPGYQ
jgi:hypothetical protein